MNDCIMRGDIFCANLNNGIGAEQRGYRPVLIIQNNTGNKFSPTVIVAVITGQIHHKARMPTHCQLSSHSALSIPSMALLEAPIFTFEWKNFWKLRIIDKRDVIL